MVRPVGAACRGKAPLRLESAGSCGRTPRSRPLTAALAAHRLRRRLERRRRSIRCHMIMCGCETRALLEPLAAACVLPRRVLRQRGLHRCDGRGARWHHRASLRRDSLLIIAGAAMPPTVRFSLLSRMPCRMRQREREPCSRGSLRRWYCCFSNRKHSCTTVWYVVPCCCCVIYADKGLWRCRQVHPRVGVARARLPPPR